MGIHEEISRWNAHPGRGPTHYSSIYDMPLLLNYSLAFGLLQTYAIVRTTFTLHLRALMVALPAIDIKVIVLDW